MLSGALSKWEAFSPPPSSSPASASALSVSGVCKPQAAATRGPIPPQRDRDDAVCTCCGKEFTKSLGDGPFCDPFCRAALARGRPVQLVDINGELIQEFPSVANAIQKLEVTEHDIRTSAQGKTTARLTELGMAFRFETIKSLPNATSPEAAVTCPKPHRSPEPFGPDDIVEIHEQANTTLFDQEA